MEHDREIAVIVVLGSVKAKEYQHLRLKHFLKGRKARIVRLEEDSYERIKFEHDASLDYEEYMNMSESERRGRLFDIMKSRAPGDVYEVVAYEEWWYSQEVSDHFFSYYWSEYWPNLGNVTLIRQDGSRQLV